MAGTINPGDAITAMKTILEADLAAILSSIDTEHSATGNEVLVDLNKIWRAPQKQIAAGDVPALVVVTSRTVPDREKSTDSELHFDHLLRVMLILRGNETIAGFTPTELLNLKIERTVRGIHEVFKAKPRLTISSVDKCDRILFGDVVYSAFGGGGEGQTLEKRAELDFIVHTSA